MYIHVCMYVCIYIYVYVFIYIYVNIYICKYNNIYIVASIFPIRKPIFDRRIPLVCSEDVSLKCQVILSFPPEFPGDLVSLAFRCRSMTDRQWSQAAFVCRICISLPSVDSHEIGEACSRPLGI